MIQHPVSGLPSFSWLTAIAHRGNCFFAGILRIGDYVTFKNVKTNSLLCAEGILLEDIIANDKVKVLDDCLFCIHLQRQYSAARELEEFIKARKDSAVDDPHSAKYFQALKVAQLSSLQNFDP